MADLTKITFSFLKKKEYRKIQLFLQKNWKNNHIFVKSKKSLFWQHNSRKKFLDFYSCKIENKIISTLGVINLSSSPHYKSIGLGIWSSDKKSKNLGGILMRNFLKKYSKSRIIATGLVKNVVKYYKYFKFSVKKFNKYYICPLPSKNQVITKNLSITLPKNRQPLEELTFKQLYNSIKCKKKILYIKKRFQMHPKYKHLILKPNLYNLFFICRIVRIRNYSFLRILDYYGSFKKTYLSAEFSKYCLEKKHEHVEFLHYGYEKKSILKSGFKLSSNKKNILPILTEPYIGLKNADIIVAFKNFKRVKIVKGDCDADRHNTI
jgi:hypothetical protein